MADTEAIIGQATFIRGNVRGDGDLSVAGRIEGTIEVQGEVVFEETSLIQSDVSADRIVVRGALAGDLHATNTIVLGVGAKVVGDIDAPCIRIEEGALFRGRIEMGEGQPAASARKSKLQTRPAPSATTPARTRPRVQQDKAPEAKAEKETKDPVPSPHPPTPTPKVRRGRTKTNAVSAPAEDQPPPPVVPALKKKSKGAVRKKSARS